MMNYYGVVLGNGYLEGVYGSKAEAQSCAEKINGDSKDPDCVYYEAEVVRGLENIRAKTRGNWTVKELKLKAEGAI